MVFIFKGKLVSIGILGEYVGRIYEEVKDRPLYVLSEVGGLTEAHSSANRSQSHITHQ